MALGLWLHFLYAPSDWPLLLLETNAFHQRPPLDSGDRDSPAFCFGSRYRSGVSNFPRKSPILARRPPVGGEFGDPNDSCPRPWPRTSPQPRAPQLRLPTRALKKLASRPAGRATLGQRVRLV